MSRRKSSPRRNFRVAFPHIRDFPRRPTRLLLGRSQCRRMVQSVLAHQAPSCGISLSALALLQRHCQRVLDEQRQLAQRSAALAGRVALQPRDWLLAERLRGVRRAPRCVR